MALLQELLHPQVIFDSITSRVTAPNDDIQSFFGFQMGGSNIMRIRGRAGVYDIFDYVREVGTASMPMTPATRISAKPIAQQPVHLLRKNEAIEFYYDSLNNMRQLGKPSSVVDKGGVQYIEEQEKRLKMQFNNFREFVSCSLLRGNVYFIQSGEQLNPTFSSSGATLNINQQVPAGNLNQLNSSTIITVPWSNTAAATIYADVISSDAWMQYQTGHKLKHIWIDDTIWNVVSANVDMRARAGTSNMTFENFTGLGKEGTGDKAPNAMTAVLRPLPGIVWHIHSGVLELNGTVTKMMSTTQAAMFPEPDQSWVTCLQGTEFVAENETQAPTERELPYFWPWYVRDPAKIQIVGLDVMMPILRSPKSALLPTVIGF